MIQKLFIIYYLLKNNKRLKQRSSYLTNADWFLNPMKYQSGCCLGIVQLRICRRTVEHFIIVLRAIQERRRFNRWPNRFRVVYEPQAPAKTVPIILWIHLTTDDFMGNRLSIARNANQKNYQLIKKNYFLQCLFQSFPTKPYYDHTMN